MLTLVCLMLCSQVAVPAVEVLLYGEKFAQLYLVTISSACDRIVCRVISDHCVAMYIT